MRHNGREIIKASTLRPEQLNLREGEPVTVACPDCGAWRMLERGMLKPHRAPARRSLKVDPEPAGKKARERVDQMAREERRAERRQQPGRRFPERLPRCPGSGQRVEIDLTPEQWSQNLVMARSTRLLEAERDASLCRGSTVRRKPREAPAPVTFRMTPAGVAYEKATAVLVEHRRGCLACRKNVDCRRRRQLRRHRDEARRSLVAAQECAERA